MTYTIEQKNNALCAFLGGPKYIREHHMPSTMMIDEEFALMGPEDLEFHTNWNWMIKCWAKIRTKVPFSMVIPAVSAIDIADLDTLHEIVSQVAINWCKENNIKL